MAFGWAQWLLVCAAVYGALGTVFAIGMVAAGLSRIDIAATGMPWPARLLLLPGIAALWPLLLARLLTRQGPPVS